MVADPDRDDVATLRATLQGAGHVVVSDDVGDAPPGVSPAPDFVVTEGAAQPVPESLEGAEKRHIAATLRFTHAEVMIPFASKMELKRVFQPVDPADRYAYGANVWRGASVSQSLIEFAPCNVLIVITP